jgi:hypothetical protein
MNIHPSPSIYNKVICALAEVREAGTVNDDSAVISGTFEETFLKND